MEYNLLGMVDKTTPPEKSHRLYRKGEWVTLNISPPVHMQGFKTLKRRKGCELIPASNLTERLATFYDTWYDWFKSLKGVSDYEMYLETSGHGLLHWHGKCCLSKPMQFAHEIGTLKYLNEVRVEVDTINDMAAWDRYIKKDHEIVKIRVTPATKNPKGIVQWLSKDGDSRTESTEREGGIDFL